MKTLNEQVNEIKKMKGSKATKKAAFIKLGLRKYEIELLLSELPKPVRESHKFTFDVEKNAKNEAYSFIIQMGLMDQFRNFVNNYKGIDHHEACVGMLAAPV